MYGRALVGGNVILQHKNDDKSVSLFIALGDGEWDGPEVVWVAGYWSFGPPRNYRWVPGRWMAPPRGCRGFVPPHWQRRSRGYVYIQGYWR